MKLTWLIFGFLILGLASCDEPEPPDQNAGNTSESFSRGPMLANIGDNIIIPSYLDLKTKVDVLEQKKTTFAFGPTFSSLTDLREAWKEALIAWQYAGFYEFGPAETHFLRSNINVYPADTQQINSNIASGTFDLSIASNLDAKGFQALDFLLFGLSLNDTVILEKYNTDPLATNRLTYLSSVVNDMKNLVDDVYNDWIASGGNYISTFKSNDGLDIGGSCNLLFNAMSEQYETYIRNGKLGIPCGALSFTQTPLPDKVEAYYNAYLSKELMIHAMTGLHKLYNGNGISGDLVGFKEYLDYLGTLGPTSYLADDINLQINFILSEINTKVSNPVSCFVHDNQPIAFEVFDAFQTLVVLIKNDLKSAIGLSITYIDADGD